MRPYVIHFKDIILVCKRIIGRGKTYEETEIKLFPYDKADQLLKENTGKPEADHWHLSVKEDGNLIYGAVFLCKHKPIKNHAN